MAVALERRAQRCACAGRDVSWLPGQRLDLGQIRRYVAALRLEHDAGGGRPHPFEVLQRARGQPGLQLTGGQLVDRRCGRPKGRTRYVGSCARSRTYATRRSASTPAPVIRSGSLLGGQRGDAADLNVQGELEAVVLVLVERGEHVGHRDDRRKSIGG